MIIITYIKGKALAHKRPNFCDTLFVSMRFCNRASGIMLYERAYATKRLDSSFTHYSLYGSWQCLQSLIDYV